MLQKSNKHSAGAYRCLSDTITLLGDIRVYVLEYDV